MPERLLTQIDTVQPNLYAIFLRISLAVFVSCCLVIVVVRRHSFCANSTKFTQKEKFMKLFFESYNELVTLDATIFFGRRCNGYEW